MAIWKAHTKNEVFRLTWWLFHGSKRDDRSTALRFWMRGLYTYKLASTQKGTESFGLRDENKCHGSSCKHRLRRCCPGLSNRLDQDLLVRDEKLNLVVQLVLTRLRKWLRDQGLWELSSLRSFGNLSYSPFQFFVIHVSIWHKWEWFDTQT